jgi:hypothetical protein
MDKPTNDHGKSGHLQDDAAHQIADNPHLQRMAPDPSRGVPSGRSTMPHQVAGEAHSAAEGRVMAPFVPTEKTTVERAAPKTEMQPRQPRSSAETSEGYIHLRVRVTDDRMRVLSAHSVDGPLVLPATVGGEHVYEVALDAKQLSMEGIPDIGVSRSFPRPNEDEHHFGTRPTIEFNVRIPRSQLPPDALSRVRLTLYRLPDPSPKRVVGMVNKHFGDQARVVASVEGLRDEHLEAPAREQLRRLYPSSFAPFKQNE